MFFTKIAIIGNGIAGITAAEHIVKSFPNEHDITIIGDEPYPAYSRIYLPAYIADKVKKDRLFLKKEEWYGKNNIEVIPGATAVGLDPAGKSIQYKRRDETGVAVYDNLLLTCGSRPRRIDFGETDPAGVFTLRKIEDAESVKQYIKEEGCENAVILGGGLLGLELAYNLKSVIPNITVCEIYPYLLPRQLDRESSELLKRYLETLGINFILGRPVRGFTPRSDGRIEYVKIEGGDSIRADLVMEQLGIIPNIEPAASAGLAVNRGIIVDKKLRTSYPGGNIYAAGDCAEFEGRVWGIIPAAREQSIIAATNICGGDKIYTPTVPRTKLKVAGIDLLCIGEKPEVGGDNTGATDKEIIEFIEPDSFICRKAVLSDNRLLGVVIMGRSKNTGYFVKSIGKQIDKHELMEKLEE